MLDLKNEKIQEILSGIHEAVLNKAIKGRNSKQDIIIENQLFLIMCDNYTLEPREYANIMNNKYDYELTGNAIIQIFRNRKLANPHERQDIFANAEKISSYFENALSGNAEDFNFYEKLRKQLVNDKKHESQDRINLLMLYNKHPEIDKYDDIEKVLLLGNTLGKYLFYDISDAIAHVYGFVQEKPQKREKKLSYDKALIRIAQLESTLERTNFMLEELQEEFEQQLQDSKIKELTDFFARLNSEKYGCILDELLVVRKGVDELRKSNYQLPIEINGLLIMTKKLIQFVRDSHIEPIMKINSIKQVIASDVEFCSYEGTPFETDDEVKTVRVVSSGWIYKDKEIQIARPKLKEEN